MMLSLRWRLGPEVFMHSVTLRAPGYPGSGVFAIKVVHELLVEVRHYELLENKWFRYRFDGGL